MHELQRRANYAENIFLRWGSSWQIGLSTNLITAFGAFKFSFSKIVH